MKRIIKFNSARANSFLASLNNVLSDPQLSKLFSYVKIGEEVHFMDVGGPDLVRSVKIALGNNSSHIGMYFDFKFLGTIEEITNILSNYFEPNMLSVSSACSIDAIVELRKRLPQTKLIMSCLAADIGPEECNARFGVTPEEKIFYEYNAIRNFYRRKIKSKENPEPFDGIICSASQSKYLRENISNCLFLVDENISDVDSSIVRVMRIDTFSKIALLKGKAG